MADFCFCSKCGADMRGPIIELSNRDMYGGYDKCRYGCGGEPHFSRIIGIYDIHLDRTVAWECPDCGKKTDRDQ
jgi:hypothetical protein